MAALWRGLTDRQIGSEILPGVPLLSGAVAGLHPTLTAWMADTKLSTLDGRSREKRGGDQDTRNCTLFSRFWEPNKVAESPRLC